MDRLTKVVIGIWISVFILGSSLIVLFGYRYLLASRGTPETVEIDPSIETSTVNVNWNGVEGESFSISLPARYKGGSLPESKDEILGAYRDLGHTDLANEVSRRLDVETCGCHYYLYAFDSQAYQTSVTIDKDQFLQLFDWTIGDYVERYRGYLEQNLGSVLTEEEFSIPGFDGRHFVISYDEVPEMVGDYYLLKNHDTVWRIVFGTRADEYSEKRSEFEQIVNSFSAISIPLDPSWSLFTYPRFSISLPPSYVGGSGAAELAEVVQFLDQNGYEYLSPFVNESPQSAIFYAIDTFLGNESYIHTTVNVFVNQDAGNVPISLQEQGSGYVAQFVNLSGITVIDQGVVTINGGEAYRMVTEYDYQVMLNTPGYSKSVGYIFKNGDMFWYIVYETDISEFDVRYSDFEASVGSFLVISQ